eukprot:TRINITY_DN11674_c2_g1_i3.p1 TRINITY_DN11674_c2_g1~~TRINITY_DN11674_c2_g1_i3.p1  ORF type:complete len:988 (+),score=263.00 TRINITY_DN11674_c2_g1_i3:171-3134(+)
MDAYRPDKFGKTIVVRREIAEANKKYTSTYYIGQEATTPRNGTTMPRHKLAKCSRKDIERLTDYFNIQVSNPIIMLTQETSKTMLTKNTNRGLYEFLMTGTGMRLLEKNYTRADKHLSDSRIKSDVQDRVVREALQRHQRAKRNYEQLKKSNVTERRRLAQHKLATLHLHEQSEHLSELRDARKPTLKLHEEAVQKLAEREDKLRSAQESLVANEQRKVALKQRVDDIAAQARSVKKQADPFRAKQRDFLETQEALQQAQDMLDALRAEKLDKHKSAAKEPQRLEACTAELEQVGAEISQLEQQEEQAEAALVKLARELGTCEETRDDARQTMMDAKQKHQKLKREVDGMQSGGGGQQLRAWGHQVATLKAEIDKTTGWQAAPLGPLLNYVRIKPEHRQFAAIIEAAIGYGNLTTFVADNTADHRKLIQLGRNSKLSLLRAKFNETFQPRVDRINCGGNPSIHDCLTFTSKTVERILLDRCQLDRKHLFIHEDQARKYCQDQPDARMRSGFHISGHEYVNNAGRGIYFMKLNKPRLGMDVETLIQQRSEELQELGQRLQDAQTAYKSSCQALKEAKDYHQARETDLKRMQKQVQKLAQKRHELQAEQQDLQADSGVNTAALDTQIDDMETQVEALAKETQDKHEAAEALKAELLAAKEQNEARKAEIDQLRDELANISTEAFELETAIKRRQDKVAAASQQKEQHESRLKELEQQIQTTQEALEDHTRFMNEHDLQEVEVGRNDTIASIQRYIVSLDKLEAEAQDQLGSPEDVMAEYEISRDNYQTQKQRVASLRLLQKELEDMLRLRRHNFRQWHGMMIATAKHNFTRILARRGFEGTFDVDATAQTLEFRVQPPSNARATSQSKTLSGGERSLVTISFIMALWDTTDCPFRCFDEFDVFMDAANRKMAVQAIVQLARDGRLSDRFDHDEDADQGDAAPVAKRPKQLDTGYRKQFIFMTPNEIHSLPTGIKLHRLQAPQRGQSTLD